jgi:hypothetical protein
LAGAVLSPFGVGTAWAGKRQDRAKPFAITVPTRREISASMPAMPATAACNGACSDLRSNPNCGACGNDCRDFSETCCSTYCADLENDFNNCGSCGFRCPASGSFEFGECIGRACLYACVEGAVKCNGECSVLDSDPNNCGACGNVCPGPNPHCSGGVCGSCVGYCPEGWCGGDGCGRECGCPSGFICMGDGLNMCVPESEPCPGGGTLCNGGCTNCSFDTLNCGACGNVCGEGETCSGGICQSPF